MCRALTICKLHTVPPRPTSHQFVTDLLQGQGRLRQTRKMSKCMQPTPPADNSAAEVHRALQIAQANGLSWSEAQCRLLIDAVLAYRRGSVYWRWKASNVARRHGKAPLGAERHIRDAGETASGLCGAETRAAMTGNRYEELSTKQDRMEREMLGMTKTQELWRAREEMGTRS